MATYKNTGLPTINLSLHEESEILNELNNLLARFMTTRGIAANDPDGNDNTLGYRIIDLLTDLNVKLVEVSPGNFEQRFTVTD